MPKHQKFPLVVTNSKKVALFESVVCLIKVLQNRRNYERQMEWNFFAECPKLFFVSYFLGKHFFLITCFWTRSLQIYQICLKFLRKSWGFPDRRSNLPNTKNLPLEKFLLRSILWRNEIIFCWPCQKLSTENCKIIPKLLAPLYDIFFPQTMSLDA